MLPLGDRASAAGFSGSRASYVALAAITTLALALLTSIWESDVSGSTALLGLLAVYMASTELLMLYCIFSPASVIIDIIRLSVSSQGHTGRGWLIFFVVLEMIAKLAGAILAYSLHKSITTGEGTYQPMNGQPNYPANNPPPYQGPENPFTAYAPPTTTPPASQAASGYQAFPTSQPATILS